MMLISPLTEGSSALLDLDQQTGEFYVDGVKFDAKGLLGHELAWWQHPAQLSKLRLTCIYAGQNWIDAIRIWHNGKEWAGTGFNSKDGYEEGQSVVDRPRKP